MKLSADIKPISYFKAHASEVIRDIVGGHKTVVITQNGEAKVILQDITEFENMQESLALLKILAMSRKNLENGKTKPFRKAFRNIRKRVSGLREK